MTLDEALAKVLEAAELYSCVDGVDGTDELRKAIETVGNIHENEGAIKRFADALHWELTVGAPGIRDVTEKVTPVVWDDMAEVIFNYAIRGDDKDGGYDRKYPEFHDVLEWCEMHEDMFMDSGTDSNHGEQTSWERFDPRHAAWLVRHVITKGLVPYTGDDYARDREAWDK